VKLLSNNFIEERMRKIQVEIHPSGHILGQAAGDNDNIFRNV
jgi:hypothetical protein